MVNTLSPLEVAPSLTPSLTPSLGLTLSLIACAVCAVFYGGLYLALEVINWRRLWLLGLRLWMWLLFALGRCVFIIRQEVWWRQLYASARRTARRSTLRLGDINPANSAMTLLEVDVSTLETRTDLPAISLTTPPSALSAPSSAFPLYTPPTTLPMPAITSTLTEDHHEQVYEESGYALYRPREGYVAPEWPPKPKQPHARTYPFILVSGIIVDVNKLVLPKLMVLPWYTDN